MRCSARRRIRCKMHGDALGGAMTKANGRVHPNMHGVRVGDRD